MRLEAARATAVAVKRLRPDASVPTQAYPGDAGFDLASCERVELAPRARLSGRESQSQSHRGTPGS